jgi:hypothetical protein
LNIKFEGRAVWGCGAGSGSTKMHASPCGSGFAKLFATIEVVQYARLKMSYILYSIENARIYAYFC